MKAVSFLFAIALAMAAQMATMRAADADLRIPLSKAETGEGKSIKLPDALTGHLSVLLMGFTKESGKVTATWELRLSQDFDSTLSVYRIAVLEAIPRLLRPMIKAAIGRNIAKERRANFILLFEREDDWKALVRFNAPDHAYVVLVDPTGRIIGQGHSGPDLKGYGALKNRINEFRALDGQERSKHGK